MRMEIYQDEWYLVFDLSKAATPEYGGRVMEISDELRERYEKAFDEFNAVQKELKTLYDKWPKT